MLVLCSVCQILHEGIATFLKKIVSTLCSITTYLAEGASAPMLFNVVGASTNVFLVNFTLILCISKGSEKECPKYYVIEQGRNKSKHRCRVGGSRGSDAPPET